MRPVWFTDWKRLWHLEAKYLGWMVAHRFDGHRIRMDRTLWNQIQRVRRIRKRLDVESEVKDQTWAADLLRMILEA